jgi:hypothetical protein
MRSHPPALPAAILEIETSPLPTGLTGCKAAPGPSAASASRYAGPQGLAAIPGESSAAAPAAAAVDHDLENVVVEQDLVLHCKQYCFLRVQKVPRLLAAATVPPGPVWYNGRTCWCTCKSTARWARIAAEFASWCSALPWYS